MEIASGHSETMMTLMRQCRALLLLALISMPAFTQPKPLIRLAESDLRDGQLYDAFVAFPDKKQPDESALPELRLRLERELSPRALARRKNKRSAPGLFDERDYPLSELSLRAVRDGGAQVLVCSRWLNGVTVRADRRTLLKLKTSPHIAGISCYHQFRPQCASQSQGIDIPVPLIDKPGINGYAARQLAQIGLDRLHRCGYTGRGVLLAVIDCGFDLSHKAFNHPQRKIRIADQWDFVDNDPSIRPAPGIDHCNFDHGSFVLGLIAAFAPQELMGSAPDADYLLYHAEDGDHEYYLEEYWFAAALERAERMGADIATSSLVLYGGYGQEQIDGRSAIMTRAMNIAIDNGVICLAAAGNAGNDLDPAVSHLSSPGDSPLAITVGAVDFKGLITGFSSDGKLVGGSSKPEVLALGCDPITISLQRQNQYSKIYGTSVATPIMAGAVACLLQIHPDWTVREIRRALFENSCHYRRHKCADPLFIRGYGIPDLYKAAGLTGQTTSPGT